MRAQFCKAYCCSTLETVWGGDPGVVVTPNACHAEACEFIHSFSLGSMIRAYIFIFVPNHLAFIHTFISTFIQSINHLFILLFVFEDCVYLLRMRSRQRVANSTYKFCYLTNQSITLSIKD